MISLAPNPPRLRSRAHLKRLGTLHCCIPRCGGWPVDPHHLTHAPQPKGMKLKVSDEYTVPLCRWFHHLAISPVSVHAAGNEARWWDAKGIDPFPIAARLWAESETTF